MTISIQESDWKYLRKRKSDMLSNLCSRINAQSKKILDDKSESEHEKYLRMYNHIKKSDQIVADCFNDWRRSNLWLKIQFLLRHDLLTDEHLDQISDGLRALIKHHQF